MTRSGRVRSGSYLNPNFLAGWASSPWWNEWGCIFFEIDRNFLRM